MRILKLDREDEPKKIEFELAYLQSLTTKERFQIMFEKNRQMRRLLKRDKNEKIVRIIKRT